jgi:abortive infection bacteriophage resistance protein
MQYPKGALTFQQQLDLMVSRGLEVADQARALEVLQCVSYYRLAGYWYGFRLPGAEDFEPGAAFDEALRLYEFDRRLRLLVLDAVERLEVALRTAITYEFGHQYGAFGHLDAGSFAVERQPGNYENWLTTVRDEARRAQELFAKSYRAKYDGFPDLPIWMASEVMSFGTLSKMLANMKKQDQKAVATRFQAPPAVLPNWIHVVSVVRNRCAHHSRLWNWQFGVSAMRPATSPNWNRQLLGPTNRTFFVLLVVKKLLPAVGDRHSEAWTDELSALLRPVLAIDRYRDEIGAFPGWENDPLWS